MKKALVIFLALAMVCSVFAAEPVAEVSAADFKGSASLTFGFDLDKLETGFKNEASAELKLNLLKGGDKSTEGDGIWGELKIKTGGASIKSGDSLKLTASVEKAVINFGPVYMGIKSGEFQYGGSFFYPNALNYKDGKDKYVKNQTDKLGYTQGFVLGYNHDMFSVELGFRSKPDTPKKVDRIEVTTLKKGDKIKKHEYYHVTGTTPEEHAYKGEDTNDIFADPSIVEDTDDDKVKKVKVNVISALKRVMKDDDTTYWTSKYAVGLSGEIKPIKDLRIGLSGAYVIGDLSRGMTKKQNNDDKKNDISVFAGVDYLVDIGELFRIQPVVAYKMYADYDWKSDTDGAYKELAHKLGMGLRFGFKKAAKSGGSSLLGSFFEKDLAYNNEEKGDGTLLPGVSVFTEVELTSSKLGKEIPLFVSFYSGNLVKNLNVAAFGYANVGSDFSSSAVEPADKDKTDKFLKGKKLQAGAAASYAIMAGDITIEPACGFLFTYGMGKDKQSAFSLGTEAKVSVKGLVDNTTFTLAWDKGKYNNGKPSSGSTYSKFNRGELTLKAEIAF